MDVNKLTNDTIAKGGVLAMLYFDLTAQQKEMLAQFGTALVDKMLKEEGVVYALGEIDEPMPNGDLFSTTVEVKILVKNLEALARVCGNHSPFSVEVKRPDRINLTLDQAHSLLMTISNNNYELKKLILEKVYKPDELERFRKGVEGRAALGKKLLEEKGEKK